MIFFDFEVFKFDWLVVFIDLFKREYTYIENNSDELKQFYDENKRRIFIGYNVKRYDKYIFQGILTGVDPYMVSNHIVKAKQYGFTYPHNNFNKFPLIVYDCFLQNDGGLKVLEGYLGNDIQESEVDFNINRPLTRKELNKTKKYCIHDVEQTILVSTLRFNTFKCNITLLEKFELYTSNISLTGAQLSSKILEATKQTYDDEFNITLPDNIILKKYECVKQWYLNKDNHDYDKSLTINIAGIECIFAWGGVHGARKKFIEDGFYLMIDVDAMYPSLMILYNLLSRSVNEKNRKKFKQIRDDRMEFKKVKDHPLNKPYKLVINPTYGAMKDPNNSLYDPLMANLVCIYGQLFLLDLTEKLEPYIHLIQLNTDGILIKCPSQYDPKLWFNLIDDIVYDWEQRTGLTMDFKIYKKIIQKDVNNYIAVEENNKLKCKGAYVKELTDLDYNLYIVNKAIKDFFIDGILPETTINNCNTARDFQTIVKLTKNYEYAMHNGKTLNGKVFRVFASNRFVDGSIYKKKFDKVGADKFGNTPAHCFICNLDIKDEKINNTCMEFIDKEYYIDLAYKRIEDFGYIHNRRGQARLWV